VTSLGSFDIDPIGVAILAGIITLVLSLILPFAIRPLLVRLRIMDVPNERSSHERPILRGLGLAVLIAVLVGGALAIVMYVRPGWLGHSVWDVLFVALGGALLAGLLGLAEDLRGLSVPVRSAFLLLIALGSVVGLILTARPLGDEVGDPFGAASFGWISWVPLAPFPMWAVILLAIYGVLFISGYINVANFMDGLNGISGFHGVIAGLTFACAGWLMALPWLFAAGLILAAGFAGFLPWNLSKPGAFLGDVGSYLLGGATAIISIAAFVNGVSILATIGPMIIYFGDVAVTLVKRVRAGHKWDEPHKEHVYQRLQQGGMSHVAASGLTAGFSAVASFLGLLSLFVPPLWWIGLTVLGLALLVLYLRLPRLIAGRPPAAVN